MAESLFRVRVETFFDPIVRQLEEFADQKTEEAAKAVLQAAIPLIGNTYSGHHIGRGPRLRDSGKVEKGSGTAWTVVFDHPFALGHQEGSPSHTMPAKGPGSSKPFYVRRGPGGYSFGPTRGPISHPGHEGNPFLVRAAQKVGLNTRGTGQKFGRLRGQGGRFIRFPKSI